MAEESSQSRKIPWNRRVGNRIMVLAVLSAMLPLMILAGVVAVKFRRDLLLQAIISQKNLTGAIQNGISALLQGQESRMEILANDHELQSMIPDRQVEAIFRFLDQNPVFFSCFVYDASGTLVSIGFRNRDRSHDQRYQDRVLKPTPKSYSTWQAFQTVMKTGKPCFASHVISSLQQKMLLVMVPVFDFADSKKIIGALSCSISLQDPEIQQIIQGYPLNRGDVLALVDQSGTFIAARGDSMPEGAESLDFDRDRVGREKVSPVTLNLQGRAFLGVIVPVKALDGYLLVAQPRQDILAFLHRLLYDLGQVLLIVLVAAGSLGFFVSQSLAGNINRLLQGIHQVSAGIVSHRVEVEGDDELAEAGSAFNQMVETLEKHRLMDQIWQEEWSDHAARTSRTGTPDEQRRDG